jgi:hypothetical protein
MHAGKAPTTLLERFTAALQRANPAVKNYSHFFKGWGGGSDKLIKDRILGLMQRADKIHFNRDLISREKYMKYLQGSGGTGNFTNWELKQIMQNPELRARTKFYGDFAK